MAQSRNLALPSLETVVLYRLHPPLLPYVFLRPSVFPSPSRPSPAPPLLPSFRRLLRPPRFHYSGSRRHAHLTI